MAAFAKNECSLRYYFAVTFIIFCVQVTILGIWLGVSNALFCGSSNKI
jgi:hypothetical protein